MDGCHVRNLNIRSKNEWITSVNGCTEPTTLQALVFNDQTVHYLPKGINKFFTNLTVLTVWRSHTKLVTQDDFMLLTQLEEVQIVGNDLETLDDDLFKFNPKLKSISFTYNKLLFIGENLLSNLKELHRGFFGSNPCINANAGSLSEMPALVQELKLKCKGPRELIKYIDQMKKENTGLKNKTSQQMSEMNSKSSEILALKAENTRQANLLKDHEIQHGRDEDSIGKLKATIGEIKSKLDLQAKAVVMLQDENSKSKRWLKSCDGNLNVVTEILFKSSDQQQIFIDPSSEPLDMIVEVDGLKFTVSELVISSSGSIIYSVKYVNGSGVYIEATELYIDHQQTLFLPINLVQHFPELQVLAVTSSGLIQIDLSVFGFMKILKVLNLNSNKLQEIESGTFKHLKLLETLDLSSNNLKTFETSAINGLAKLQNLNLAGNRLKAISSNIFESLKVLQIADLSNNSCINLSYPKVTLKEIKDRLIEDCTALVEIECFWLEPDTDIYFHEEDFDCVAVNLTIVHHKTKISQLKRQIGYDSSIFSVIDQHIEFLPHELSETFANLHILVVVRSKLSALRQRDFEGLTNLKNITIVSNDILLIEPGMFDDVPQLEILNLSSNNIKTLPEMIFAKLAQLKTLNLSDNKLQSFFSEFLPLNNVIEEFYIKNNELKQISSTVYMELKKSKIIDLTDNVCIDFKYDEGKTDSKTLTQLYQALRACKD